MIAFTILLTLHIGNSSTVEWTGEWRSSRKTFDNLHRFDWISSSTPSN